MAFVTSRGVEINYEVHGDDSNPPVLFCNGYGPPLEFVVKFYMPSFMERFYCATYDVRGIGGSEAPEEDSEFSILRLAQDGLAVMDDLGWQSAHVWGVSLGAIFGAKLAALAPHRIRSLVLNGLECGAPNVHQQKYADTIRSRYRYLREPMQPGLSVEEAAEMMISFYGPTDTPRAREIIAFQASFMRKLTKKPRSWSYVSRFIPATEDIENYIAQLPESADPTQEAQEELLDDLDKIQASTLIMHGFNDPLIHRDSALQALVRIKNAELRLSKASKHSFSMVPHILDDQADWVMKREAKYKDNDHPGPHTDA